MATPMPNTRDRTSQKALRTVSNSQIPLCPPQKSLNKSIPTGRSVRSNNGQDTSKASTGALGRRQLSKSHGDLSQLRPKSPLFCSMAVEGHCINISPSNSEYDRQDCFLPSYDRQIHQALPRDSQASRPHSFTSNYKSPKTSFIPIRNTRILGAMPPVIRIQDLSPAFLQPLDFCIPYIRPYPSYLNQNKKSGHGPVVEHLDISNTWNGLQFSEAQELFRIHQAFVGTLEHMLAGELWQIYRQSYHEATGSTGLFHLFFTSGVLRGISFCRNQLVGEMADALYSSEADIAKARTGLFSLYLAANDSLVKYNMDDSRDTSITVRMYCDPHSSYPNPIVEAAWVPDTIHFEGLSDSICEGEEFSIIPQYQSNAAFGAARSPQNVRYIISSAQHRLSWLSWSKEIAGFKGIVPVYSEMPPTGEHLEDEPSSIVPVWSEVPLTQSEGCSKKVVRSHRGDRENPYTTVDTLQIEIKATLIDDNGSVARYERVVRARITLKVIPWHAITITRGPNIVPTRPSGHQNTALVAENIPFNLLNTECPPRLDSSFCYHLPSSPGDQSRDRPVRDPFAAPLSVTRSVFDVIELANLAQRHADLAAKYIDLAQRQADAARHVKLLSPSGDLSRTRRSNRKVSYTESKDFLEFSRLASESRASLCSSGYTTEYNAGPPSPVLHPKDQILEHTAGFSTLPTPAYLIPSQEFDQAAQTWNRVSTPKGTAIDQELGSVTPMTPFCNEPNCSPEQGSRKRRARSSFEESPQPTPSKRAREGEATTAQNTRGSTTSEAVDGSVPVHDCHVSPANSQESPEMLTNLHRVGFQAVACMHEARSTSNEVQITVENDPQKRQVSRKEQAALWASLASPAISEIGHTDRNHNAVEQATASARCLDASLSDLDLPSLSGTSLARITQLVFSDKGNQTESKAEIQSEIRDKGNKQRNTFEEPKLSKHEQQAMDEAIARSLEDIMGKIEDVFLEEDTSSCSNAHSEDDDELGLGDTDA